MKSQSRYGAMKRIMSVMKLICPVRPHVKIVEVNIQTRSIIAIDSFLNASTACVKNRVKRFGLILS